MSKLIKKWKKKLYADTLQYNELYEDKLVIEVTGGLKKQDKLTYFLNNDIYPMNFELKNIFEVFNRAIYLPNQNKSNRTLKITEFYKAFNKKNMVENEWIQSQKEGEYENKICVTQFGTFQQSCNFHKAQNPCNVSNLQLPHDFFFYGPSIPELSLKLRNEIKHNLFNSLNTTDNNKNLIGDGFKIFDYDKVKALDFLYEKGSEGKYLRTFNKTGKIVYGGWSNPRDGGEYSISIEAFYYKSGTLLIDEVFKSNIRQIKEMLDKCVSEISANFNNPQK